MPGQAKAGATAGGSHVVPSAAATQHRGPSPARLQLGAWGLTGLPGHISLCFPAGQPCRGWSPL